MRHCSLLGLWGICIFMLGNHCQMEKEEDEREEKGWGQSASRHISYKTITKIVADNSYGRGALECLFSLRYLVRKDNKITGDMEF